MKPARHNNDWNVKCVICNRDLVSIGKYFEDEYKDCRDKYICLGCKAARDHAK